MDYKNIINPGLIILFSDVNKKKDVLDQLITLAQKKGNIRDIKTLTEKIFYREELMSTGMGLGIAIPHVRFEGVKKPVIAIGIQPDGVKDYKSIDDKPIKIIVLIIAGKNQHKEHITLMAQIVKKLKSGQTIDDLVKADSVNKIFDILTGE
ncbi:MAG: PTS sugar transporter subunit IIA [Spirochaetes bacterium]|nr:PTS sugar transporter subunit IIA [Spirochaetota bacterium]